jgi:hypothetical protein
VTADSQQTDVKDPAMILSEVSTTTSLPVSANTRKFQS